METDEETRPIILAVDDRPENLLALEELLGDCDARILTATSGQRALEIALDCGEIAVALLDVQMPEMDGFEIAQLLRMNSSTRTTPIIFVTATSRESEHVFKGYECGAVDFLRKPIAGRILRSKVEVFLQLSRQNSELTRALTRLEESELELKRSNKALQDFAHVASHDLRAPLRQMRQWAMVTREDCEAQLDETAMENLARIESAARHMSSLVESLLQYAGLDASPPEMKSVNLQDVFDRVIECYSAAIDQGDAVLHLVDPPTILGDEVLLYQLFQNLVGNALKYRRPDVAPRVDIGFETDAEQAQCTVTVSDNGIGFDPSRADGLFEPFTRLVSGHQYEGCGIGLSTVKRIVELHGGTIHGTSVEGEGACFTLTLSTPPTGSEPTRVEERQAELS